MRKIAISGLLIIVASLVAVPTAGLADDEPDIAELTNKAEEGDAKAQNKLGEHYWFDADYAAAVGWFRKAAGQGHARAQHNLGLCYSFGAGVEKDRAEAVKWYRKAAEQGHGDALCALGVCYANGRGVEEDQAEAVRWYRKAAEQGHKESQFYLGRAYLAGEGVPQDYVNAHMWHSLSGNLDEARPFEKHMTPAQLTEAKRLTREWLEKHQKDDDK